MLLLPSSPSPTTTTTTRRSLSSSWWWWRTRSRAVLAIAVMVTCVGGLVWGMDVVGGGGHLVGPQQQGTSHVLIIPTTIQETINSTTLPQHHIPTTNPPPTTTTTTTPPSPPATSLNYPPQKKWHNYDAFSPCTRTDPPFQIRTNQKLTVENWDWNDDADMFFDTAKHTDTSADRCNLQYSITRLTQLISETQQPRTKDGSNCIARARAGEPILMQLMLRFAVEWDKRMAQDGRESSFLCDWIVEGPKSQSRHHWWRRVSDLVINKDVPFDWEHLARRVQEKTPNRTLPFVIFFARGSSFCMLLEVNKFKSLVSFPIIIVGPWGDGENYGPFSSKGSRKGEDAELGGCQGIFETRYCGLGSWARLVEFLEDDRLLLWLSFSQTIDHPKVVSVPLGLERRFWGYAKEELPITVKAIKTKLVAVTFTDASYGMRNYWIRAVEENTRIAGKVEYSHLNPWNKTLRAQHDEALRRDAFIKSMHVYRNAKLVVSPAGLGQDTKRPFEAMIMGSVPLMLRTNGLEKTYAGLPVVFVDNFDDLSALEDRYVQTICAARHWKFEKLTWWGWLRFIHDVKTGTKTMVDWVS